MLFIPRFLAASALLLAAVGLPTTALADLAIVVHPNNPVASLSPDEVNRIYLGKEKKFPDGNEVTPLDQDPGNPAREQFYDAVVGKSEAQAKAYWSKLIFTGKGTPPRTAGDDAEIKAAVAADPTALSYIDAGAADDSVKVVLRVP